jgi:hypothetical protein
MNQMDEAVFQVASFGARVGTRLEGEAAHTALLSALTRLDEPCRLLVSLDGIEVLSGSFADEAIALPYSRLAAGEYGDRYLVIHTPSLELADDLSHKLEQRHLAMLCRVDGGWEVLGLLPPPMRETLALVIERGSATAKELAATLDIRHNACLHRVGRLSALRLVGRESIGIAGPHPAYRFFSILRG